MYVVVLLLGVLWNALAAWGLTLALKKPTVQVMPGQPYAVIVGFDTHIGQDFHDGCRADSDGRRRIVDDNWTGSMLILMFADR
ncbi:hypothetical protein QVA66_07295 [Staphylococcus chromogenes]|nr:hypothetical protein [Staphylococcus chromogenes]